MVVLSTSIISGSGKALFSRQFVEMNRMRIEGLLAAFPKLVGIAKQHTYVETDTVRYVYQPLENDLFLLLITTKASNIVEDLNTLRLLAKVVPDVAGPIYEANINEHAFELIFAFDEVITADGYREEINMSTIRANLEMDSHEERVALAIQESKQAAAREEMAKKSKEIKERQMLQMRNNFMQGPGMGGGPGGMGSVPGQMEGFGGGGGMGMGMGMGGGGGGGDDFPGAGQRLGGGGGGGMGGGGGGGGFQGWDSSPSGATQVQDDKPKVVAKGMKLGGVGKKKDNLMAAMAAEDNLGGLLGGVSKGGGADAFGLAAPAVAAPSAAPSVPISIAIEEKVSCQMNREGGIESCDVKGTLTLTANTDAGAASVVVVNKAVLTSQPFTFATHPKVSKQHYETKGTLALKGGKQLPIGRPVGVLRWSYAGEDAAPLTINCWPEDDGTGGVINVNIEFELNRSGMVLQDVNIVVPLGTTSPPDVQEIDGQYKHDPNSGMLCWHQDSVDSSNSTGSLEFSIPGGDVDAFFPVQVSFRSESLMCPIEIESVSSLATGQNVPNALTKTLGPDTYQCA